MTTSAFGVEHTLVRKYSKVYGTNRLANLEIDEAKKKKIKQLKKSKLKLIQGDAPASTPVTVIKPKVAKAYGNVASRLERAAASTKQGSKAHEYASSRIQAGAHGKQVRGNLRIIRAGNKAGREKNFERSANAGFDIRRSKELGRSWATNAKQKVKT